jgi:hypothetical protein
MRDMAQGTVKTGFNVAIHIVRYLAYQLTR